MKHCLWILALFLGFCNFSTLSVCTQESFQHTLRASRPELQPTLVGSSSGSSCDAANILASLQACCHSSERFLPLTLCCQTVLSTLTDCCHDISTTMTLDVINTITSCCSSLITTITQLELSSTVTTEVVDTLTACCNTLLTTLTQDFHSTTTLLNTLENIINNASGTACCPCTMITQAAVDSAGGTYIIRSPGSYTLAQDISTTATVAVVIATSNVSFDLCFHKITGGETTVDGIVVNDSLSNITITNGLIDPIRQHGIHVFGPATNITIRNIYVTGAGRAGIALEGINDFIQRAVIEDCHTELCATGIGGFIWAGLGLFKCADCVIQGGTYSNNNQGGVALSFSQDCRISNVVAQSNSGHSVFGILLDTCIDCLIDAVMTTSNVNTSSAGAAYGILLSAGRNNTVQQSIASGNNTITTVLGSGQAGIGIGLANGEQYTTVINCIAEENQTNNPSFNNNNVGAGIYLDNTTNFCTLTRNSVSNNTTGGIIDTSFTLSDGDLATGDSTTLLSENSAINNGTTIPLVIGSANSNNYIIAYGGATPALPPTLFVSYSSATPFPVATMTQASLLGNLDIVN